jgi:hypothetical protein
MGMSKDNILICLVRVIPLVPSPPNVHPCVINFRQAKQIERGAFRQRDLSNRCCIQGVAMFVTYLTWNVSGLLGHNDFAVTNRDTSTGILHIYHTLSSCGEMWTVAAVSPIQTLGCNSKL